MGVGFLWSKSAYGTYWLGDPKTVGTLGVTFFYLSLVYMYYAKALRGKRLIVLSLVAYGFIFVNFFGLNLLGRGVHQLLQ
jgi:ABC-type transport system involved in cytochrome c biogenesis permease subunit